MLLTSGLRIEEACELTTFDVLRRSLPDGRLYYLLHIKPSKFGRARVIPIGDQLGRAIAEIIRHVRGFYGTDHVPLVDRRDEHEKRPLPRVPYLLQGIRHPSAVNTNTIRGRLRWLSEQAGARHADGAPLVLTPHDCLRVFASEHLNAHTPVHVIQALLGQATIDTVMIYAKLYPDQFVTDYRKAMRGLYTDVYGPAANQGPSEAEWAEFTASCSLRDMGTHVCALPTGEHCPRGLVCLGCGHAQPKKSACRSSAGCSAATRALGQACEHGEPAGQIAARELEVERIRSAMQRAQELTGDAAEALEAAAAGYHHPHARRVQPRPTLEVPWLASGGFQPGPRQSGYSCAGALPRPFRHVLAERQALDGLGLDATGPEQLLRQRGEQPGLVRRDSPAGSFNETGVGVVADEHDHQVCSALHIEPGTEPPEFGQSRDQGVLARASAGGDPSPVLTDGWVGRGRRVHRRPERGRTLEDGSSVLDR